MIEVKSAEKKAGHKIFFKGLYHVIYNDVRIANARKTSDDGVWLVNPFPIRFSKKDQTEKRMTLEEINNLAKSCL